MMSQLLTSPIVSPTPEAPTPEAEPRVVLQGVSWQQYESLLETLGDDFPALRLSYLEGTLEIMSTSRLHETLKCIIGMLLEAYLIERDIWFHGIGAATFRKSEALRGLEPDECYCFGEIKDFPDLAIEVVVTSGVVNKLDIYRGLGVTEVWAWNKNQFTIRYLREDGYEIIESSELLPECDVHLLANYVRPDQQFESLKAYRVALRATQAVIVTDQAP